MNDKQKSVPELRNDEWLLHSRFLVDTVYKLNELNISLLGKENITASAFNHIRACQKKLLLSESQ